MCCADRTTLWRALLLWVVQSPYQAVLQNALNCASVTVCDGFRWQAKFLQPPEVVFLTTHSQCPHPIPTGCLVVVGDQAYYCYVVCKLDDQVGGVHGHTVMGEQGVQEGADHTPLWGSSGEDQRSVDVVSYLHHLGANHQENTANDVTDLIIPPNHFTNVCSYQIVSKMDNRTCMVAGWSNHLPICEVVSCVPEATDGRVVVSGLPDDDGVIQYGHELKFSCPNPAHQLKGNPQVVCAAGGMWNNHFPTCEDVTCEAAEKIKNVNVIGIPQNNTMKVGHRLQFECSNSKHVLKGKSEVTCSANGQWSHSIPICYEPKDFCGPPPQVNNGDRDRTRERYRNGESVQYMCQKFYILDPPSAYKTCRDGIWTRPITSKITLAQFLPNRMLTPP
ncbi:unnamed protein product [Oncorhynchus mykiss]|uniref:Sushi domain-containing protein n=1 Tax=Oncorhynchus mykiss TaxID=8022 RepID=A0A060YBS8_ONCMY|nr:unnamed protein product [Oncorhynchus mykiss]